MLSCPHAQACSICRNYEAVVAPMNHHPRVEEDKSRGQTLLQALCFTLLTHRVKHTVEHMKATLLPAYWAADVESVLQLTHKDTCLDHNETHTLKYTQIHIHCLYTCMQWRKKRRFIPFCAINGFKTTNNKIIELPQMKCPVHQIKKSYSLSLVTRINLNHLVNNFKIFSVGLNMNEL